MDDSIEGEIVKGDSFDLGHEVLYIAPTKSQQPDLSSLINNPKALMSVLELTEQQAENVSSLIAGAGAALGHKWLKKYIGPELSAGAGAVLAAYIAKKLMK